MFQIKEQDKYAIEICNLPDRKSKMIVINIFTEVRKAMCEKNWEFQQRNRKYIKVPNINHWAE